jgi:hypothetical protein
MNAAIAADERWREADAFLPFTIANVGPSPRGRRDGGGASA